MFKDILIPVDFEINTEMAVKKAIELSDETSTTIHLHHVQKPSFFTNAIFGSTREHNSVLKAFVKDDTRYKLEQWKELIETNYANIKVNLSIDHSTQIQKAIVQKARDIKADLIIIGKHSHHQWRTFLNTVSPNQVAKSTGYPVLTFKPGSLYTKIRSIVVPIGPILPQKKIDLIIVLKQKFRISIHLLTVVGKNNNEIEFPSYSFLETYRSLKQKIQCPLSHEIIHGENIAQSALQYAKNIKADILLVEPVTETKLSSFPQKHIIDELRPGSKLQILAVRS